MYDAIIIGAGPGGYECAKTIVELGGKPLLVEKDSPGGTCTNWGCIPTKALVSSIETFETIKSASRKGITAENVSIDFSKVMARKDRIVKTIVRGIELSLKNNNIELIKGEAHIISKDKVKINDQEYVAKNIVIATGSEPIKIFDNCLTSKDMLSLTEVPETLTIVGGGAIGVEFGNIFKILGSNVTIIEALPSILPNMDKDVSEEITNVLKRKGIKILTGTKAENPEGTVLCAIGRRPKFPKEELNSIGVKSDRAIEVNKQLQTSIPSIYAVGDCTGQVQLAHVASMQGIVAAHNIMDKTQSMDYSIIPACVYTTPEAASVGVNEQDVEDPIIKKATYASNAKARTTDSIAGFLKIITNQEGTILGIHIVGTHATDLIQNAVTLLKTKSTLEDIKNTIHAHPSLGELFFEVN